MASINHRRQPASPQSFTKAPEPTPGLVVLKIDNGLPLMWKVVRTTATLCAAAAALYIIWTPTEWWRVMVIADAVVQGRKI